ncbi:GH32 C-terminal domain-containing protein [uncultured Bacteroides sp.]|uniref:GH32 C-terminal domain-containing protein n=1 Tax=uncultured Bacteroides sp. TaxID=162156 RepID=UPI002AAC3FB9|nr:GH32 C-terminal domain-containing protein [uncultured Bacteroides sp.]
MGVFTLFLSCQASNPQLVIKHLGDEQSIVQIDAHKKYLLLPVQETSREAKLYMIVDNDVVKTINIRLAINKIDYFVPVEISAYKNKSITFNFQFIPDSAVCWKEMKLADSFDTRNIEAFRPVYHFTPTYGWMNDPNGMVYKDGEYHLFYQHNPYGSMWGNMHWGHAVSKDLVNWEYLPVAIAPDALGSIFSGSCVVDKDNTAGFGAGAIVAFYTSASDRQVQSMAYSLDNGRTFTKYTRNPILTSTTRDFRDPKVFWHEPSKKWVMILAAGQEMRIYSSSDLKEWAMESRFGDGQGAHGGVWECPDLIELPIEGTELKKWVLICNINPGGPFGGSATQYFVGKFDGKKFINESPNVNKWMDWGKDHYATVTWSNALEGRHIALAWMSNWQYANDVPTKQYRSANSVPRDLSLYTYNGETYLKSTPSPELLKLRREQIKKHPFKVDRTYNMDKLLTDNSGAYEIEMTIKNKNAEIVGFQLFNSKGEEVDILYNLIEKSFSIDRTKSGITSFSKEFPAVTTAPLMNDKEMTLRLFVDKSSIEAFGDGGRFTMTNLIFPSEPYNRISFYAKGGSYNVVSFTTYKLGLK